MSATQQLFTPLREQHFAGVSWVQPGPARSSPTQNIHIRSIFYLYYVLIGQGLVGLIVLGVLEEDLVHVRGGVLVELVAAAEDDQGYFTVAEYRELVSLFHHPELSLVESHLGREVMLLSCW